MTLPLRDDYAAPRLRAEARKTKDAGQARRLMALAAIYDSSSRTEAAEIHPFFGCARAIVEVRPASNMLSKPCHIRAASLG